MLILFSYRLDSENEGKENSKIQSLGFLAIVYMVLPFNEMKMKSRDSFWLGVEIKHSVWEILNLRYLLYT